MITKMSVFVKSKNNEDEVNSYKNKPKFRNVYYLNSKLHTNANISSISACNYDPKPEITSETTNMEPCCSERESRIS